MIILTTIVVGVLFVTGVVAILQAANHAPEGYEDELGFHQRLQPAPVKVFVSSTPDSAGAAPARIWIEGSLAAHTGTRAPYPPMGAC